MRGHQRGRWPRIPYLLIGYGSPLRGDDAVGALLAERLAERSRRGRRVIVAHQLLPEHAADLAQARVVIFADADVRARAPRIVPLRAGGEGDRATGRQGDRGTRNRGGRTVSRFAFFAPFGVFRDPTPHHLTPESLLAHALALYGRAPRAYLLRLPARGFDLGAPLTPVARRGLRRALRLLGQRAQH